MGKIWAVCSGSGGVGKTTIATALAVEAAKARKKIILLDASFASRSADLILGMESIVSLDMLDVLRNQIPMESAVYAVPKQPNLRYACAALHESISVADLSSIILVLHTLCDVLVVDLPTGQCDLGRGIMRSGDHRLFVTRPDSASVRATERLMMRYLTASSECSLIINRIQRDLVKRKIQFPRETIENLLDRIADACIPEDPVITEAESKGKTAVECFGSAHAAIIALTKTLLSGA